MVDDLEDKIAEQRARRLERGAAQTRRPGPAPRSSDTSVRGRFSSMSPAARWGFGVPLTLLALTVLIVLGDLAVSAGRVHPGVVVAGVKVGGLSESDAAEKLNRELGVRMIRPVTASHGKTTWKVDATRLGADLDATATADAAFSVGREETLAHAVAARFAAAIGGVEVTATLDVDAASMVAFLDEIDAKVAVPAKDAAVKLEGLDATLVPAADGVRLDRDKAVAAVTRALVSTERSVGLELVKDPVRVTDAEARDAIAQTKKLLSGPVTVRYEDKSWSFEPDVMAGWVTYVQVYEGTTTPADSTTASSAVSVAASSTPAAQREVVLLATFSPDAVSKTLTPLVGVIGRPAVDAQFLAEGGAVTIKASQTGLGPDVNSLVAEMERTLKKSGSRDVTLKLATVQPALTTEQAQAMGIKERISTFTTTYSAGATSRVNNIHTLADALNNKLVPPGGVFDFNATVGERTAAKGYQEAPAIVNGKLEPQLGGGICQIGTTFFNTVFFSGLPVIERKNHSFYISHYPKGRDATITWGGPNLRWKNDTEHWVLIRTSYTNSSVTVSLYGTSPGYTVSYTTSEFTNIKPRPIKEVPDPTLKAGARVLLDAGEDGKSCTVVRTVTKDGAVVRTDNFVSVYKPKEETVRVGTKVTPSVPTSPTP